MPNDPNNEVTREAVAGLCEYYRLWQCKAILERFNAYADQQQAKLDALAADNAVLVQEHQEALKHLHDAEVEHEERIENA